MSEEKEVITTTNGTKIEIDPSLLISCVDDVTTLVKAHTDILLATKSIIKRGIATGLKPDEAASIAMELSRRAGKKAGESVHMEDET